MPVQRLIVSFIGKTDLKFFRCEGDSTDLSPIIRLLLGLPGLDPHIPTSRTRMILFSEDRDGSTEHAEFCTWLRGELPRLGLDGLNIQPHHLELASGPTDLNALYAGVWAAIPRSGSDRAREVLFHVSSGTYAMQFTLILAASCLPLEKARLFETSREQGVREVLPPYVLAARAVHERERTRGRPQLPEKARKQLLPDTVIDDWQVGAAYAAIHKAAIRRTQPARLLVRGPVGSGKWRACEQFARWRGEDGVVRWWTPADLLAGFPESSTVLIRHLDGWPNEALKKLTLLAAQRSDAAFVATLRTDLPPAASPEVLASDGLRGAAQVELPALGARRDVSALGEALVRQLGAPDGKVRLRLGYELLTDAYPRNLHDLKEVLSTAVAYSSGAHLDQQAYRDAKHIQDARALLGEAWQRLNGLDFAPGRSPGLRTVLDVIRFATVQIACSNGRNQREAGALLGIAQQNVSEILRRPPDLTGWRTRVDTWDEG